MTQEELQKTQVLNLKDVEEAARFERITSKKPAIIVATIGLVTVPTPFIFTLYCNTLQHFFTLLLKSVSVAGVPAPLKIALLHF